MGDDQLSVLLFAQILQRSPLLGLVCQKTSSSTIREEIASLDIEAGSGELDRALAAV